MARTLKLQDYLILIGFPSILCAFLYLLSLSNKFQSSDAIINATTLDLLVTLPIGMLAILHWKGVSKIYIMPVFLLAVFLGGVIIPIEKQGILVLVKYTAVPLIEVTILGFVLYKARAIYNNQIKVHSNDFFDTLVFILQEKMSRKVALLVANEIAIFYYLFSGWKSRIYPEEAFSYHKKSGGQLITYTLLGLILTELFVTHYLLSKWNETFAWVLTALSGYGFFQIMGILKGMAHRPIILKNGVLRLRYSFVNAVDIKIDNIVDIEETRRSISGREDTIALSILGEMEPQNIILHLRKKHILDGLYGSKKPFKSIAIFIDNKEQFISQLRKQISLFSSY